MPKSETFSQVGGTQEVARGGTVVGDYTSDYYGGDWDYIGIGGTLLLLCGLLTGGDTSSWDYIGGGNCETVI